MATILDFPQGGAGDTVRSRAERGSGASAEVVLFPGVRYERWEEPQAPKARNRRKAVKRDTLDILE